MTKITQRLEFIDAARALAAFLVVVVHVGQHFPLQSAVSTKFTEMGLLGVQVFFVASAFTIFASLERSGLQATSIRNFFISRFCRIAPLYYLGIALYVFIRVFLTRRFHLSLDTSAQYSWQSVLANLALIHGLVPAAYNSIVPGGWSIGTEWLFYCLAPVLFKYLQSTAKIVIAGAVSIAMMVIVLELTQGNLNLENASFLYCSILNQFPIFACGMLLYFKREWFFGLGTATCAVGLIAIALTTCYLYVWCVPGPPLKFMIVPLLAGLGGMSACMLLAKVPTIPVFLRKFGQRSYSVYLLHFFVVFSLKKLTVLAHVDLPFIPALILIVSFVYWASGITYHYIEKPCIDYSKRFTRRPPMMPDTANVST